MATCRGSLIGKQTLEGEPIRTKAPIKTDGFIYGDDWKEFAGEEHPAKAEPLKTRWSLSDVSNITERACTTHQSFSAT